MISVVRDRIMADPAVTERLLHVLSLSHAMERIADYATNISENVVYIHEGRIVRHGRMQFDDLGRHESESTES
jgi:phosphate transport system protein